jgi:type II secretory pathway pseudopilin PulG
MRRFGHSRGAHSSESGYALVMIMFFLALLVIGAAAAAPTVLSNIQRDREADMVWRGKQYTRGIRMYYQKWRRFPTSLDDLTKPKSGLRFMRKEYKDPMNPIDGSWRLIYVGPNGQLIGSLANRNVTLGGQLGAPAGGTASSSSLFSTTGASAMNSSLNQNAGTPQGAATGTALASGSSATSTNSSGQAGENPDAQEDPGQPHPLVSSMDSSNTIGGNIIGVGSKVNRKSFMWYEKAKNYRLFEFVWDPSKDLRVGSASVGIGTPVQSQSGASSLGTPIQNSNGTNPGGTTTLNPSGPNQLNTPTTPGTAPDSGIPPLQAPPPNQ